MKPILIDAKTAFKNKILERQADGIKYKNILVPSSHIYSKVQATMYGLNDGLVAAENGGDLRSLFDKEMIKLSKLFETTGDIREYGTYAYYARTGDLVQYAPLEMNRLAMVASNSSLYLDPQMKMSYPKSQEIFRKIHPGVMGLSVGSNIVKAIMQVIRPDCLSIADPAMFKATNQNRVTGLSYNLMLLSEQQQQGNNETIYGLRNKAEVLAEQLYGEDPYVNISVFKDGVTLKNMDKFLKNVNIVIDVADSTEYKLALAQKAREQEIRYIRITDAGDSVWMDIRPFDLDKNISISPDISDQKLFELEESASRSREDFFRFADALVGDKHRTIPGEFNALVNGKLPKYVASIPQSGATTMVGGGWCSNTIARMFMGHKFHERMVFDMRNTKVETFFKVVPGLVVGEVREAI